MKRQVNKNTGETTLTFSSKEYKQYKYGAVGIAVVCAVSLCVGIYASVMMTSLQAQNQLYQNQLNMAAKKLEALEQKAEAIDRISSEVQSMISGGKELKGQGGGTTVPDAEKKRESINFDSPSELLQKIVELDSQMNGEIKTLTGLVGLLTTQSYVADTMEKAPQTVPEGWPVGGEISSEFGWRQSPAGIGSTYHEGVDIANDYNTPVHATADGDVTRAEWVSGYGYMVEINHGGGFTTRYGHNSALLVSPGQHVNHGDIISLMGSTGNSTGPHSHYEVRMNGSALDPELFMK